MSGKRLQVRQAIGLPAGSWQKGIDYLITKGIFVQKDSVAGCYLLTQDDHLTLDQLRVLGGNLNLNEQIFEYSTHNHKEC